MQPRFDTEPADYRAGQVRPSPWRAVTFWILFALLASGCESDLEQLNATNRCVRCFLNESD
ncbi:MAG: hypothetical protein VYD96_02080, partial [Pseudomonadota bacterium]|nr:hypothetical protein [Pseudomonadota bacterium]